MDVRWGILGAGYIARKFAEGIAESSNGTLVAVGARTKEGAEALAIAYQALALDLVRCPEVDAIYIATPHVFHCQHTLLALSNGKSVLCEKPFAVNALEAAEMVNLARSNNHFLMEAMWTRFCPGLKIVKDFIKRIGRVESMQADFSFKADYQPEGRLFNSALGGGALLDVGIYPISLAIYLFGFPDEVNSRATLSDQGIDLSSNYTFKYNKGLRANLAASITEDKPGIAIITGEYGQVKIGPKFWHMEDIKLTLKDGTEEVYHKQNELSDFTHQVEAVGSSIASGQQENSQMSLDDSVEIMKIMDLIRQQCEIVYRADCASA